MSENPFFLQTLISNNVGHISNNLTHSAGVDNKCMQAKMENLTAYLAVSPGFSVRFLMILFILGKPHVFTENMVIIIMYQVVRA